MTASAKRYDLALRGGHLRPLWVLATVAVGMLAVSGASRSWYRRRPPLDTARQAAAVERIDPNTASRASLRRLPGIGPTRAQQIVDYRRTHGPGAFATPADLEHVHGIGRGTVRTISPHLDLPNTHP